jgi:benzoyl-CoA reductase/2-hydroxyglutaryl-CoA dehydratase subunit BcrC/BadD/HgdB
VPVLNLEVDCIDERNFALGQLRTRVEAFVELLAARRASRGD